MTNKATAIIEDAIAALRAEAADIKGKISALENALEKSAASVLVASPTRKPTIGGGRKKLKSPELR